MIGYGGSSPTPCVAPVDDYIYDDALSWGWNDYSYSITINWNYTTNPERGVNCIQASFQAYGGIQVKSINHSCSRLEEHQ